MKLSKEQLDNLLFQYRPFTIKVDGIWRAVMGVYIPPIQNPLTIKCILNGKEIVVTSNNYVDYTGCNLKDLDSEVVKLNMSTLPPPKPKKASILKQRGNYAVNFDWRTTPITGPLATDVIPPLDNTNEQF